MLFLCTIMKTKLREIELLAPARNADIAIEAIIHGADAVYMGPSCFGARSSAGNATSDIARVAEFAHQYGARVYATVNTIIYDNELARVERLIHDLYRAGVDALIVQDMGILRLDLPPIALHASTQCDLRTPEKARFLQSLGFSQLVMARELTLHEIKAIHSAVDVPFEAFVHGALCVSYSGRCQVSQCLKGRSANRGECAQICRLAYDLEDAHGNKIVVDKHLLSLRDFMAQPSLAHMLDSGVSSFKIEGRLKDMAYVKNVVAYYRQELDKVIATHPDLYRRSSWGKTEYAFTPDVSRSFNRSFTTYFLQQRRPANGHTMASTDTPKSLGQPLGRITSVHGKHVRIDTRVPLHNGDGISFFDKKGNYCGFRINRVQGQDLFLKESGDIPRMAMAYRTSDKSLDDVLSKPSATRRIDVDARLWWSHGKLCLALADERGNRVVHSLVMERADPAKTSQEARQLDVLAKLGNTIYRLTQCDVVGDKFVPVSMISQLRHEVVEKLGAVQTENYNAAERLPEDCLAKYPSDALESQDNVANSMAREFYADHGVKEFAKAIETEVAPRLADRVLMHTRYCLRRELGMCLKERGGNAYRGKLYLVAGERRFEVKTDCEMCEMRIIPNRTIHR